MKLNIALNFTVTELYISLGDDIWNWILQGTVHLQQDEADKLLKGVRLDILQSVVINIPVRNSVWGEQWGEKYPGISSDLIQSCDDLSRFSLVTSSWNKVELHGERLLLVIARKLTTVMSLPQNRKATIKEKAGKVCIRAKWPIRPKLISVILASSD